jgi:hypothetical protein
VIAEIKEEKFFEIQNMKKIKAKVPIQYTSLDGVSPEGFTDKGSRLSNYVGGSKAANYRKVGIGFGERVDFNKVSGDKAYFLHDY